MIVVSDNGPVGFLVQIGKAGLLQQPYGEAWVPTAVMEELSRRDTPNDIRQWASQPSAWLIVKSHAAGDSAPGPGSGERDAIRLAKEQHALLLCDDRPATNRARREGLLVTGTLGVLRDAHAHGWADIEESISLLATRTDFRLPPVEFLVSVVEKAHELAERRLREQELGHER